MPDGTILQNRGMGVRWGPEWQQIDGGTPLSMYNDVAKHPPPEKSPTFDMGFVIYVLACGQ